MPTEDQGMISARIILPPGSTQEMTKKVALEVQDYFLREERAQGTTEYAILVGVLVVIAILAIVAFRDKVSELWEAISSGINSL